jgi:hypothetical protein
MSNALNIIAKSSDLEIRRQPDPIDYDMGETITLTGCGCKDAYNPSQNVRKLTNHKQGSPCRYWNMCLLCDNSIITENSLPKLIAYRNELSEALKRNHNTMKGRNELYQEIIARINNIVEPDELFPEDVIIEATYKANNLDAEMLDQLIYQGL